MSSELSINSLKTQILNEAKKKAEKIIKDAQAKAKEIENEALNKWKRMYEEKRREYIEKAESEANTIIAESKRKARMLVSKAKYEIIEELFRKAYEKLAKREGINVKESLEKLFEEAFEQIPPGTRHLKIYVNPRDKELITRIIGEKGVEIEYEIITREDVLGGLILETLDGIIIDNTYNTRLERAKETIVNKLAKVLWEQ